VNTSLNVTGSLYYEDEAGVTAAWTYWNLQQQASETVARVKKAQAKST